ncbi:hypothetical protein MY4038_003955 [Beauveria bassiana]
MTADHHLPRRVGPLGSVTAKSVPSIAEKQQHHAGHDSVDAHDATIFWRDQFRRLAASQPVLHGFPLEHSWPRSETAIVVPDGLLEQVVQLCSRFKLRLDDLLYATWAIVAAQHTISPAGETAVVFTIPGRRTTLDGQGADADEDAHDLPLVVSVSQDASILSQIRHVADVADQSAANGVLGHDEILRLADASRPQVKLRVDCKDLALAHNSVMSTDDKFPLVINICTSPLFKLSMRHDAGLAKLDARLLLEHFVATLEHVARNVKSKLSAVRMISPVEEFLLHEYAKAAVAAQTGLLHQLIETQALRTPNADAVQFENDEPVSYLALNQRANQLARHLLQYRPRFVAVHMRTSTSLIISLLAILKAGAAYVILDVDAAYSRKAMMVEDVAADFVLVDEETRGQFPIEYEINQISAISHQHNTSNLFLVQQQTDVAYAIYTSGSTGRPKAARLDHRAAYNGLVCFPHVEGLRQLLFFNPVFSAAQRSIWATLTVGGCLCLAEKRSFTVNLADTIQRMAISSIDMTSTTAALITPDQVPTLRRMVLGGELVSPAVVETWGHRVQLYSSYGLSECTQLNWRHRLHSDAGSSARVIGMPYDTTTSYIVDPNTMELSPLLVPGELCLGGAQIASGYLNAAEETAKRFVANPFGDGKIYRTGDMAVRHADGSVELVGRIDFQAKINGQRVDPAEPNSFLQKHESVKHSAVVPCIINNKTVLVAAVVMTEGETAWPDTVRTLRSYLAGRLPGYMMPTFWVPIDKLPLNANDKVDVIGIRNMVEESARAGTLERGAGAKQAHDAVFSHAEAVIRALWSELLSLPLEAISLQDSFVSLGGTSLEAIQVVSRLQSQHGLTMAVEDMVLDHTLAEVARLAQQEAVSTGSQAPAPFSLLRQTPSAELLGIEVTEVEDAFPVTALQEAVVANAILGGTTYVYSRSYSFRGYSEQEVTHGLQSLMESQPLLRTTFIPRGTSFVQVIKKTAMLPLIITDLDAETYIRDTTTHIMRAGELWWQAAILPGQVLVITSHHALFDYWSNQFIPQDLSSILVGGAPVMRGKFSSYVKHLQSQDVAAAKDFWKSHLDGARSESLGHPTPVESTVTALLGMDLKKTASKLKITPSVLLYATWSLVLSAVHSTDDVVMGVTLSGRDAPVPGILEMAGPTLMIAPLRVRVDGTSSFASHSAHVKRTLWDIAAHAHVGLRTIFNVTGQSRDLFDSMVNFLIKVPHPSTTGGLHELPFMNLGEVEHAKLELNNETPDRITLASTLESGFAQSLVDLVVRVLSTGAETPNISVKELLPMTALSEPELPSSEMSRVVTPASTVVHDAAPSLTSDDEIMLDQSWPYTSPDLGFSAVMRMAALHPSRTAVRDLSGEDITYAGLAIKIHQFAGILHSQRIKLEQIIPVLMEKSINTIISIFGILVAGGALLPLGPENPRDRNVGILDDCEATHVITDSLNKSFFDNLPYKAIVMDDIDWDSLPIQRPITPGLNPDSLAYVIYTSGSTGKPKGTLITHGALAAATEGIIDTTNLRDNPFRILWTLNYTFDGSFDGLFSALSSGSTLCVAPQNTIVANLANLINTMEVDRVNITPSMGTLFHPDDVPRLKVLMTGGEAISLHILNVWAPRVVVYNVYGPTEATICISTSTVAPGMNPRSVGRIFKSTHATILDPDTMNPVADGEVGELCVSGPQLARGYLKRPDATAKAFRFVGGKRIYQTGDLARLLPSGEVELHGRKDGQVKLNGYRIELGEIDASIVKSGSFKTCVTVMATVLKKKQIVAFCSDEDAHAGEDILLPADKAIAADHIMARLTSLPKYMLPTVWLPVANWPLTPSGKVDKKRLQQMVEEMSMDRLKQYLPREEKTAVSGEQELVLQSIWADLFEVAVENIHGGTTFHSLGGDSISALNLAGLLRRKGFDIKVNDLLSAQTLQIQAKLLSEENKMQDKAGVVQELPVYVPGPEIYTRLKELAVAEQDIEDIYPCSPGQVEFLTQGNKREQFWQLMTIRELPKDLDFARWVELTTMLTARNQILRAMYVYGEEGNTATAVQVILKQPTLNLSYQSYATEAEFKAIVEAEWDLRFNPAKVFVRYTLLTNSATGTRHILIKLDHASYDGTLLHIFDDQFKALNHGVAPRPSTEFRDFIGHIRETPKQPQLDYWTSLLKDKIFDYPARATNPRVSRWELSKIGKEIGVDETAQAAGVTAPIAFQTAYGLLLAHLSGSPHVVYNNLVTGRNVPLDNPQLINGNCANFLPFVHSVDDDDDAKPIGTLLQETQASFWRTTENGLVSLDEIYGALGVDRDAAAAKCLFCFQPFEPVDTTAARGQDHMRWIVMKMSRNTMHFNYAMQLEVVKGASKGEYVVKLGFDDGVFTVDEARSALAWYEECLRGMSGKV